jgi:hypothetical protein
MEETGGAGHGPRWQRQQRQSDQGCDGPVRLGWENAQPSTVHADDDSRGDVHRCKMVLHDSSGATPPGSTVRWDQIAAVVVGGSSSGMAGSKTALHNGSGTRTRGSRARGKQMATAGGETAVAA